MPVSVYSKPELSKKSLAHLTHLIQIEDPGQEFADTEVPNVLRLNFYDVNAETGWRPPTRSDIDQAVAFAKDADLEKIGVQCTQGRSRSTALAAVLTHQKGRDWMQFLKELAEGRTVMPNEYILALGIT